ncbi:MAG: OmpA family protein [Planctomycetota bacterium]
MTSTLSRFVPLVLALAAMPLLVGCNDDLKLKNAALVDENVELRDELDRTRAALDSAESERSELLARVNQLELTSSSVAPLEPGPASANTGFESIAGIETYSTGGTVNVRIPGDVLFSPGKVDLRGSSTQTLSEVAGVLNSQYPDAVVRVEGYTDTDPIRKSKWADNLELSLQRSAAVHRYLAKQGVSPERMYAAGFGETRPQGSKAQSRRVEIVVVLNE